MAIKWSAFSNGAAIADANNVVGLQSGANVKWTWAQAATYLRGLVNTWTNHNTFTAQATALSPTVSLTSVNPQFELHDTAAAADARRWNFHAANTEFQFRALNDAGNTPDLIWTATRTGNNVILQEWFANGTLAMAVSAGGVGTPALFEARGNTATPAAAAAVAGVTLGSANIGIYWGTGSPSTALSAPKGSLFINTDGVGTGDRMYINTDGATAWTAFTTAG